MKKYIGFLGAVFLFLFASISYGAVEVTVFDNSFVRGTGEPVTETKTFPGISGSATIKIYNGGLEDTWGERVSSSIIKVNGQIIFDSSNFNQNVASLEKEIILNEGQNNIEVLLKSKPDGKLAIQILQNIEAEAAAVVGPEGGTLSTLDGNVTLDIPAATLSGNTILTVIKSTNAPTGNISDAYNFGPDGTVFDDEVEVTFNYDPTGLPNGVNESDLRIGTVVDGQWRLVTESVVNTNSHMITGILNHFSTKGVVPKDTTWEDIAISETKVPTISSLSMPVGTNRTDLSKLSLPTNSSYSNYPITFENVWYVYTAFNENKTSDGGNYIDFNNDGGYDFHPGEDWNKTDGKDKGVDVYPIAKGVVIYKSGTCHSKTEEPTSSVCDNADWKKHGKGYGNTVILLHKTISGEYITSFYGHLMDYDPDNLNNSDYQKFNEGEEIDITIPIGKIGTTGTGDCGWDKSKGMCTKPYSPAYHLHFEIRKETMVEKLTDGTIKLKFNPSMWPSFRKKDDQGNWIYGTSPDNGKTFIDENYYDPSKFIKEHEAPSTPSNLSATAVSSSQINLSWTASPESDVTGYKVYETVYNGNDAQVGTSPTNSYSVTGLNAGTMYCYVVSAYDAVGSESEKSSSACATTQAAGFAPSAPIGVTATAGNGQVTISWNPVSGADSYNIYWSTTSGVSNTSFTGNIPNAASPYTHTLLTNGTTYYYVVTAVNSYGESLESSQVSATPAATTGSTIQLPKTGQTTSYATGDDGDLENGAAWPNPRFTVSGDCVTDNLTGLMWVQSPDSTARTWQQALDYATNLSRCGYTDWRLPNRKELRSLVNYSQSNAAAWLNTEGFSNVLAGDYWWSSTAGAGSTGYAWLVSGVGGPVIYVYKTGSYYVLPVRAGQ